MRSGRTFLSISSLFLLVLTVQWGYSRSARAAGDCGGGWVDDYSGEQDIGCSHEDANYSGSGFYGDCYGECGQGCSWYNCGSGGCCETHDYYTRTYGLWSSQAMSAFPCAIVQWGGCVTGRGVEAAGQYVYSKLTGAYEWASQRVAGWN